MPSSRCSAELRLAGAAFAAWLALAGSPTLSAGVSGDLPDEPLELRPSEDPAGTLSPPSADEGMPLQLAVVLNGRDTGLVGEFRELPEGGLSASAADLRSVGIKPPGPLGADAPVRLGDLPGLIYLYDVPGQRVVLDAPFDLLMPFTGAAEAPQTLLPARSDWGAALDYSAYGYADATRLTLRPGSAEASLALDARAFSPWGVLRQTGFATRALDAPARAVRLDSTYAWQDPSIPFSAMAGDVVTPGPPWARPVRLAGVQGGRDYGLRPDIVTSALPVLSGTAAVPTTVDVFVNGTRTFSQDVPAGPYAIASVPGLSGSGLAEVVTRDVTGREVRTPLPFYTAPVLLRAGIVEYSAQGGYPRYGYGRENFAYAADPVASGALRAGVADWLTVQAYGEAGAGLRSAGAGVSVNLFDRAVLTLAGQGSRYGGRSGFLPYLAFQTRVGPLVLSGSTQRRLGSYEDLASVLSHPAGHKGPFGLWSWDATAAPAATDMALFRVPRALDQASASLEGPVPGSLVSFGYVHVNRKGIPASHLLTAGYSQSIGRNVTLYASAWRDWGREASTGVTFGLSAFLGDYGASTSAVWDGGQVTGGVSATKLARDEEGSFGFRVRGDEAGAGRAGSGGLTYVGRYGRMEAGLDAFGAQRVARAGLDGSLAWVGTSFAAGRRTDGAFAIVRGGAPGIPVMLSNRMVGTTDFTGNLLVPGLVPGFDNRVAIDVERLPPDIVAGQTEGSAVPLPQSGVLIDFATMPASAGSLVTFVGEDGEPVPAGSNGIVGSLAFVVGYDGQAYLVGLSAQNEATLTLPDGRTCQASFASEQSADGAAATIGPVACVLVAPVAPAPEPDTADVPETGSVKPPPGRRPVLRGGLP
jgi:outer membrane usher protein